MFDLKNLRKAYTLEKLIDGIDQRGLLVLQVLIGQRAMGLLSEEHLNATGVRKDSGLLHSEGNVIESSEDQSS